MSRTPLTRPIAVGPDGCVHYALTNDNAWLCGRGSGGPGPNPSMMRHPLCEACCAVEVPANGRSTDA